MATVDVIQYVGTCVYSCDHNSPRTIATAARGLVTCGPGRVVTVEGSQHVYISTQ